MYIVVNQHAGQHARCFCCYLDSTNVGLAPGKMVNNRSVRTAKTVNYLRAVECPCRVNAALDLCSAGWWLCAHYLFRYLVDACVDACPAANRSSLLLATRSCVG
ncbi:hypothetical protein VPH35_009911 [Triticum aestivum]